MEKRKGQETGMVKIRIPHLIKRDVQHAEFGGKGIFI